MLNLDPVRSLRELRRPLAARPSSYQRLEALAGNRPARSDGERIARVCAQGNESGEFPIARPNVRAKPAVRRAGLHTDQEPGTVAVCEAVLGSVADSLFGAPCVGMVACS